MNRIIKFRCFDTEKKIMVQDCSHVQREGIEVMQFTGLTDCHGTEIYEGDIVKWRYLNNDVICPIVFDEGCFATVMVAGNYPVKEYLHQGFEVIGNIYENSDLLTEKGR